MKNNFFRAKNPNSGCFSCKKIHSRTPKAQIKSLEEIAKK